MPRLQASRPNILLIICHDLGRRLGCYQAPVTTPHLDGLAEQGITFTDYFCPAAQCSPSRGSIMTGRYPHRNGLMGLAHLGWGYHEGERTLPTYLEEAGYHTHLFGVQHESADPTRIGYGQVHPSLGDARSVAKTFSEWIAQGGPGRRPFFACLGTTEPHRPYHREGYPSDDPATTLPLPYLPDKPGIRDDLAHLNGLIRVLDEAVGHTLGVLDEAGLSQSTLVIFTTDHGIAMPRAKGTCYDPGLETALLMRLPGRLPAGRRENAMLCNVDLLPTLLELAGVPLPGHIDGLSFLPLLAGEPFRGRDDFFIEMTWHDKYNPMRGIRTRRRKYICNIGDLPLVFLPLDIYVGKAGEETRDYFYSRSRPAEELYDLVDDPMEQHNLAGEPAHARVLADLRRRVQRWMRETHDPLLHGGVPCPVEHRGRLAKGEPNDWPRPTGDSA